MNNERDTEKKTPFSLPIDPYNPNPQKINELGYTAQPFNLIDMTDKDVINDIGCNSISGTIKDISDIIAYMNATKENVGGEFMHKAFVLRDDNENFLYIQIEILSPKQNLRPTIDGKTIPIDTMVIHGTDEFLYETIDIFYNPKDTRESSSHYVVSKSGIVVAMVPEEHRAWHAGVSYWNGKTNLNDNSIGIEVVNNLNKNSDQYWDDYSAEQKDTLIKLSSDILRRNKDISAHNIVAHQDIAPNRKMDPGPVFPWEELAKNGIGVLIKDTQMPEPNKIICKKNDSNDYVSHMQNQLNKVGYKIEATGMYDQQTEEVVAAFKAHFVQSEFLESNGEEWTMLCNNKIDYYIKNII